MLSVSCARLESDDVLYPYTETVIPIGATVSATNSNGTILITATSPAFRRYRWRGRDVTYGLAPRSERWYGSLGIYSANAYLFGRWWSERGVFEEAQMHFPDDKSARRWLAEQPPRWVSWTRSGLFVYYGEVAARDQLNADVLQICIHGRKPTHLDRANDRNITITGRDGRPVPTLPCRNPGRVNNDGPS